MVVVGEEDGARAFFPVDEVPGAGDAGVVVHGAGLLVDELVDVCDVEESVFGEVVEGGAADVFLVTIDGDIKEGPVDEVGGFKEAEGEGGVALVIGLEEHHIAFAVKGNGVIEDASKRIMEDLDGFAPAAQVFRTSHKKGVALPGAVVAHIRAVAVAGAVGDIGIDEVVLVQDVGDFLSCFALDDDGVVRFPFGLCAIDGGDVEKAVVLSFKDKGRRLTDVLLDVTDVLPDGAVHSFNLKIKKAKWFFLVLEDGSEGGGFFF